MAILLVLFIISLYYIASVRELPINFVQSFRYILIGFNFSESGNIYFSEDFGGKLKFFIILAKSGFNGIPLYTAS